MLTRRHVRTMPFLRAMYTNSTRRLVAVRLTFILSTQHNNYTVRLFFRLRNIGPLDMFRSFVLSDTFYTQLSGPGIELAIMISFIKLRSALKLIGSQDFVENGFNYKKKKKKEMKKEGKKIYKLH